MKVKVLKRFNDKNTHERKDVDKVYEYPEARAKELEKNGFVKIIPENKGTDKEKPSASEK